MKYLKDKRVEVYGLDEITKRYDALLGTYWAYVTGVSIKAMFGAGASYQKNDIIVVIAKPVDFDLTDGMYSIKYNGKKYTVEAVDILNDRSGGDYKLLCRETWG